MRFYCDGPAIPDILLEHCDAGRVVFLCGAGVSSPSGMPDFVGLTRHVIEFFDPPEDSDIMSAFQPWLDDPSGANMPLDQIFNLLHQEYGKDEVNTLVTERLDVPLDMDAIGREHGLIKRISSNQSGVPQIVTTNFDRLFESRAQAGKAIIHVPPSFPDLTLGTTIEGITYLHGRLADASSVHHSYVLSSADFGRAYLSEGWATNFIRNLLQRFTVVLVGYKAEDPPIKYLLQGLNHDGQYDSSRLYAFDRGLSEDIEAKWRDRGVTAIAYKDHADLWRTMEAWADRSDDPRKWRESVIAASQDDPKKMVPHERGQVAHVLRTTQGAKLFSEADPTPHPEWICVLDANVRFADQSYDCGEDSEVFDPKLAYGLDNDLMDIKEDDNLLVWRVGDDNPHDFHRLANGLDTIPVRLRHLITWIGKSIDSPVLAWWAIRQRELHPRLIQHIDRLISNSDNLHVQARHVWMLIVEHCRDSRSQHRDGNWFDLKRRVNTEGWTASVIRYFRYVSTPSINIRPPLFLSSSKPPTENWDNICLSDLGQFEIKLLERHNDDLEVPDEVLPQLISILEEQLYIAAGLLEDIETNYFPTPSCYPDRKVDGRPIVADAAKVMELFVQLFDRISDLRPELASAHATIWVDTDKYFFRKFKLYALAKTQLFDANDAIEALLSFDQKSFWDLDVSRELLFLLVDRWSEFSTEHRNKITERILAGPDQRSHWSEEEYPSRRDQLAARYCRYLELENCVLLADHSIQLATIIEDIPDWNDGWATAMVTKRGSHSGYIGTDEAPDEILNLPLNEVVTRAKDDLKRDFRSFTERRPFTGLVKINPRRALSALTVSGKEGDYPKALWSSMINDLPEDIPTRLRFVFLHRLTQLPYDVIVELRDPLAHWLEQNLVATLEFDNDLAWAVYDHYINGVLNSGANATVSNLGDINQRGKVIKQSRRTYEHAINGPLGMCVKALFHAVPGDIQERDSLIPEYIKSRVEQLFSAPDEGADHAVSITMSKLNWLMFVDSKWTQDRLIPMLTYDHPASEPAWNGFLHSERVPWAPLAKIIKPILIDLFPRIDRYSWDHQPSAVAAQWLGLMYIFHTDKPEGLSKKNMRLILRSMSDQSRNRFIFWLSRVGQDNENGWTELVIPFINDTWPRERKYRTSASMNSWISLLELTGSSFPSVYEAMKRFLVPVEANDQSLHWFTYKTTDEEPISMRFPKTTLDLMNIVTPQVLTRPPYGLPKVLAVIAETDSTLTSDPRYLRLIDLVEKS